MVVLGRISDGRKVVQIKAPLCGVQNIIDLVERRVYMSQSYGDLWKAVNDRHKELIKEGVKDEVEQLKKEFNLSTAIVWEIIGISDMLMAHDLGYEINTENKN